MQCLKLDLSVNLCGIRGVSAEPKTDQEQVIIPYTNPSLSFFAYILPSDASDPSIFTDTPASTHCHRTDSPVRPI